MKINSKINKRVNESMAECHKVLVNAIIELLKQIGTEVGQDVLFRKTLFLFQSFNNTTETKIADRIAYCEREGGTSYFIISMGSDCTASDAYMNLSNLKLIYDEVRKIVLSE